MTLTVPPVRHMDQPEQVLARVAEESLDLVGLRIVWPSWAQSTDIDTHTTYAPPRGKACLVLALRGIGAGPRWLAAVGPEDPLVARQTDPRSLRALLGTDRDDNVCTVSRAGSGFAEKHALPLYFGGRLPKPPSDSAAAGFMANNNGSLNGVAPLPAVVGFPPASVLLLTSPAPGSAVAGCLRACHNRGCTVQAYPLRSLPRFTLCHPPDLCLA